MQAIETALAVRVLQQPLDGKAFWLARPETASRVRGGSGQAQKHAAERHGTDWLVIPGHTSKLRANRERNRMAVMVPRRGPL